MNLGSFSSPGYQQEFQILGVLALCEFHYCEFHTAIFQNTVRPRDTRPQAARALQVHVFELGPKNFELNEFM